MADKLWVFDTNQYLEVYAPTLEAAESEVRKVEADSGLDFVLHHEWQIYQDEHETEAEICPTCHGNGYWVENLRVLRQVRQCEKCNSQGEIKESSDAKINGN
jgi:hypothetical protein